MYQKITQCRLCGHEDLAEILNLGMQTLTGIFPKLREEHVPIGPLELMKCAECDLVQLAHNYDLSQLYGETYGYRSGLNTSMVRHLQQKVKKILERVTLEPGDVVLDIGSNDSTLLRAYPDRGLILVGIDPSGPKFKRFYPDHIQLIPDFFSAKRVKASFPGKRVMIITSIAMFYDLEHPMDFVRDVNDILDEQGVWVFEQSYLPFMLTTNSYDTVCHEHLEYYALKQIKRLMDDAGLKIVDLELNDVNGGSFSVMAAKQSSLYPEAADLVKRTLQSELEMGLSRPAVYAEFNKRVHTHKQELKNLLKTLKQEGKKVLGYGASTKGNVLIQFCGLNDGDVPFIAEVNEDKFGAYTPGSRLPIISEREARAMKPDYFIVFPWHFKKPIIEREQEFLAAGGKLIFPLPHIEIVSANDLA